ncbi:MAG: hypothetical protein KJ710_00420, partial [Candidatus Omnitrophica bacterium]|nr:hypothetical protein [Candidatus Omnitrophota bacterium]MBU1922716.1 hypothetical protein [Candidatus Omnitrophota bacterium]
GLAKQIIDIARYAYKHYVVFYFYRPLLLCMFNKEEMEFLRSISPFLFDTVCSCSCIDGTMVTINPDLSCFPCPSLSLKGLKIVPGVERQDIYRNFKDQLSQVSLTPFMDSCRDCEYFINYLRHIKNEPLNIAGGLSCHGGCFQYRCLGNPGAPDA